jgi:hypothetical protein|tara:strand:+ start:69 stop:287 length:219 start_codon:yes stop_codon:yes gene_type:complete
MNEWDYDNLMFLIKTNDSVFQDWIEQADNDDVNYALELFKKHRDMIAMREIYLRDDITDFSDAKEALTKFRK